jgi:hypothetical protein
MDTSDYDPKMRALLDPSNYRKLKRDPTSSRLRQAKALIKVSSLDEELKKRICKSEARAPLIYGLPKIHKDNVPLRPIVSTIDSPTYDLVKVLTTMLRPHVGNTDTFVKDSTQFVEKLQNIQLGPNDRLVSFDVVSLFTLVPIRESLNYVSELFPNDITKLFELCLSSSYFQWKGEFYEQIDGCAMGNPLSPAIANFFMEKFEQSAIEAATKRLST